jgi:hypothetical protein
MEWRKNYWRWLLSSPAKCHEFAKLELPGAWEPLDNSGPLPNGKGKEPNILFSWKQSVQNVRWKESE